MNVPSFPFTESEYRTVTLTSTSQLTTPQPLKLVPRCCYLLWLLHLLVLCHLLLLQVLVACCCYLLWLLHLLLLCHLLLLQVLVVAVSSFVGFVVACCGLFVGRLLFGRLLFVIVTCGWLLMMFAVVDCHCC
jgi:hypothetical protein